MISNWAVLDLSNVRTTAVRRTFTVDGRVHVYNMDKFILIIERWTIKIFILCVLLAVCYRNIFSKSVQNNRFFDFYLIIQLGTPTK